MSGTVLELKPIPAAAPAPQPPGVREQVRAAIDAGADIATLTAIYVKLRDAKKDIETQAKAKTAPLSQALEDLESHFLAKMQELKVDSLKNEAGTPYTSDKSSVTVADNDAWLKWVIGRALEALPQIAPEAREVLRTAMIESGAFAFLEARASKTAVEAFMEETQQLPPGLNRRVETVVNVRAS